MRIVHVAETVKGGVATVISALVNSQLEEQHKVTVVAPLAQVGELAVEKGFEIKGFSRVRRGLGGLLALGWRLGVVVWRESPDIVHLHSSFAGLVGRPVLMALRPWRSVNVVYCAHGWGWLRDAPEVVKGCTKVVERWLAGACDAIVCVSQWEQDSAAAVGLPTSKLVRIYNGVPVPPLKRKAAGKGDLKVLFVGRFDRQKGFDVLLAAMRLLEGQPVHLTAVGEALDGTPAPTRPNVTYTGWLDGAGVAREMAKAEVLVVPSRWEGFAMVPLEGMGRGLPVVASRVCSLPEEVRDGETGVLVPVNDATALAAALRDTPRARWRVMGEAGHAWCAENFNTATMTAQTLELYRALVEGRA